MLLKTIKPIAVRLPLAKPIKMANVTMAAAENLLVRLQDEEGRLGWGEAASAPAMTGETAAGMVAAVSFMAEQLAGREVEDLAELPRLLDAIMYGNQGAKSAIEMAAYDLLGKRRGVPVYELLGGRRREAAPALWMLAAADLKLDGQAARAKADEGFTSFKVKVGVKGPNGGVARDLERVAHVRATIGSGLQVSADANQGYAREEAVAFAQGVDADTLDFLEQPVAGHDMEAMRAVASAGPVPVGADEGIHSIADIERHAEAKAAQGVSLKTIKLGGLAGVMEAGRRAEALGMKVNLAGKMADSSIASAAIAHLAVALPHVDWAASVTNTYLAADLVTRPLALKRGHVAPAEAPGLGVEVDEARVAELAFRP